jgi:hypothetical protein
MEAEWPGEHGHARAGGGLTPSRTKASLIFF